MQWTHFLPTPRIQVLISTQALPTQQHLKDTDKTRHRSIWAVQMTSDKHTSSPDTKLTPPFLQAWARQWPRPCRVECISLVGQEAQQRWHRKKQTTEMLRTSLCL